MSKETKKEKVNMVVANSRRQALFLLLSERSERQHTTDRIVGGTDYSATQHPYQVEILVKRGSVTYLCSGSIVTRSFVMTAAHCLDGSSSSTCVFGVQNIKLTSEPNQVRVVTTLQFIHPGWNNKTLANDIAFLQIPTPINYTAYIQPIRLPRLCEAYRSFSGMPVMISGWGIKTVNTTTVSSVLQVINKTVLCNSACTAFYDGIPSSQIFTEAEKNQTTCQGDSGGPLVYREPDGNLTQIGVVSFGCTCGCASNCPTGYTRVTSYFDFIQKITGLVLDNCACGQLKTVDAYKTLLGL